MNQIKTAPAGSASGLLLHTGQLEDPATRGSTLDFSQRQVQGSAGAVVLDSVQFDYWS